MAKLARESGLRERRLQKQAKKDARRREAASPPVARGDSGDDERPAAPSDRG